MDISNLWTDVRTCWNGIGEEMMKTPEQMALAWHKEIMATGRDPDGADGFVAGYNAAMAQLHPLKEQMRVIRKFVAQLNAVNDAMQDEMEHWGY
jgi:hypothetical protein